MIKASYVAKIVSALEYTLSGVVRRTAAVHVDQDDVNCHVTLGDLVLRVFALDRLLEAPPYGSRCFPPNY